MGSGVTMSLWDALLQGCIAIIFVVIGGLIIRVFVARTFKGIDDNIKNIDIKVEKELTEMNKKISKNVPISECSLKMEKCIKLEKQMDHASEAIIRLQEASKILDSLKKTAENIDKLRVEFLEKYQPKADFIREMAILNSQLESIHKMITRLDEKFDSLKNTTGVM